MSTRINHNILSLAAQRNLSRTQNTLNTTVNRLSSGLRINNAWEDPAGLAISERFRAQIASMQEAERNANYNINMIDTAEGALSIIDEMLIRMRALAVQAANGALETADRDALNVEFKQLRSEVSRIAESTNYNNKILLDGRFSSPSAGIRFHIGTGQTDGYVVTFANMTSSGLGLQNDNGFTEIDTVVKAQAAITTLDTAMTSKDTERTQLGSYVERLQHTISNLQIQRENAVKSESSIRDADVAQEMSEFVRAQILMNSGISMLSQANMIPQMVAALIG